MGLPFGVASNMPLITGKRVSLGDYILVAPGLRK
jgi:hypothetical protein